MINSGSRVEVLSKRNHVNLDMVWYILGCMLPQAWSRGIWIRLTKLLLDFSAADLAHIHRYGFMSVRALHFGKASEPRKWTCCIPKTRYTSFPAKDFNLIREVDAKGDDIYSLPGPHFALPKLLWTSWNVSGRMPNLPKCHVHITFQLVAVLLCLWWLQLFCALDTRKVS